MHATTAAENLGVAADPLITGKSTLQPQVPLGMYWDRAVFLTTVMYFRNSPPGAAAEAIS